VEGTMLAHSLKSGEKRYNRQDAKVAEKGVKSAKLKVESEDMLFPFNF
jgi:hypothetical protein